MMKRAPVVLATFTLAAVAIACGGGSTAPSDSAESSNSASQSGSSNPAPTGTAQATWSFNGSTWQVNGTPGTCPSPLLGAPVDLSRVTSILYPGQVRSGDYRAHGGFRFDQPGRSTSVAVTSPMDAVVYRGARYIESGETQHLFDFINSCGIMFRLDHLIELSSKFAGLAAALPPPSASSTTTTIDGQTVAAGEAIATAVGFRSSGNVFVDWGVYDLRQRNPATTSRSGEFAPYGACWLDLMSPANNATVRALPPGDQSAGRTSDYCR